MLIVLFLNIYKRNDTKTKASGKFSCSLFISTVKHLKNKYQLLIIPITFWIGIEQAYINADFTKVSSLQFIIR